MQMTHLKEALNVAAAGKYTAKQILESLTKELASEVDISISDEGKTKICESLNKVLSSTYVLSTKTQTFHWNVTGPFFGPLHEMFGKQYDELSNTNDLIAERIRALGFYTPVSLSELLTASLVKEESSQLDANQMIAKLMQDNQTVSKVCKECNDVASQFGDDATMNMMADRMQTHQKAIWMLRSLLKK